MEASMFAKLVTVIVVLGAMFGALLVNRQERIDTAAEISRIHFKLEKHDRERTRREAEIATALTPARIRELLAALPSEHETKPVPFRGDPSNATEDALGAIEVEIAAQGDGEIPRLARESNHDDARTKSRSRKERGG
jgi:hypothetical protein